MDLVKQVSRSTVRLPRRFCGFFVQPGLLRGVDDVRENPIPIVIPAKAGIQFPHTDTCKDWIPAFAGMTSFVKIA